MITNLHKFQLSLDIESIAVITKDPVTLLLSSCLIWSHLSALVAKTPNPMTSTARGQRKICLFRACCKVVFASYEAC